MKKIILILMSIVFMQVVLNAKDNFLTKNYSSSSISSMINEVVGALSMQLTKNKNFTDIENKIIAIEPFVSLEDLKSTNRMSYILSENLIHEMQVRGYQIVDFKTMNVMKIKELKASLEVDYILSGTYVKYQKGIVINARIIDLKTYVVLSSAQIFIPRRVVRRISSSGDKVSL